jgi:hypothetical protein
MSDTASDLISGSAGRYRIVRLSHMLDDLLSAPLHSY